MKKIFLKTFFIFAFVASFFVANNIPAVAQQESESADSTVLDSKDQPTLFVREGCSHCRKVEEFLNEYNLKEKIEIKDVVHPENSELYTKAIEDYSVSENEQGFPILFVSEEYFVGDDPIIRQLGKTFDLENEAEEFIAAYGKSGKVVLIILGIGIAIAAAFLFFSERKEK